MDGIGGCVGATTIIAAMVHRCCVPDPDCELPSSSPSMTKYDDGLSFTWRERIEEELLSSRPS